MDSNDQTPDEDVEDVDRFKVGEDEEVGDARGDDGVSGVLWFLSFITDLFSERRLLSSRTPSPLPSASGEATEEALALSPETTEVAEALEGDLGSTELPSDFF